MNLKINRAKITDARTIRHILHKSHQNNIESGFRFPAGEISNHKVTKLIARHRFYLCSVGKVIIGTVAIKNRKKYVEIGSLAVHPSYQKQRVGTSLLRFAEKKMKTLGEKRAILFTPKHHSILVRFYLKNGYRKIGTVQNLSLTWVMFQKKL